MTKASTIFPFWRPELGSSEQQNIEAVLSENYLNEGRFTTEFESRLASLLGVPHVVAVTSCTAALYLSLYALGVGPGDEVLVPDVTFVASASAVTMTGARPILVDVDEMSLMIDLDRAAEAVTERTRAVMPVHISGRPAPMDAILKFAKERSLLVVEDAAEALLSRYQGRYLGTIGDAGCFSFSPNKTITTGQGGAVVTHDSDLYRRLCELKDQGRPHRGTGGDDTHDAVGFNFKLTNLQAAVGLGQLELLEERARRLTAIRQQYMDSLKSLPGLRFPTDDIDGGTVPQWVDVVVPDRRDDLVDFLQKSGMNCRKFWHPIHTHRPYRLDDQGFPVSTRLVPNSLWLPSAFQMTTEDVAAVCQKVRDFFVYS